MGETIMTMFKKLIQKNDKHKLKHRIHFVIHTSQ